MSLYDDLPVSEHNIDALEVCVLQRLELLQRVFDFGEDDRSVLLSTTAAGSDEDISSHFILLLAFQCNCMDVTWLQMAESKYFGHRLQRAATVDLVYLIEKSGLPFEIVMADILHSQPRTLSTPLEAVLSDTVTSNLQESCDSAPMSTHSSLIVPSTSLLTDPQLHTPIVKRQRVEVAGLSSSQASCATALPMVTSPFTPYRPGPASPHHGLPDVARSPAVFAELWSGRSSSVWLQAQVLLKVPFEYSLTLVASRDPDCTLYQGFVYLERKHWHHVMQACFSNIFIRNNVRLKSIVPEIGASEQFSHIVNNVSLTHLTWLKARILSATLKDELSRLDCFPSLQSNNIDELSNLLPLCMQTIHRKLRDTHHLKYLDRFPYTLFIKDAGMSLAQAVKLILDEFRLDPNMSENHIRKKRYEYNIRHIYGKEGRRIAATSLSCKDLMDRDKCSFKLLSEVDLRKNLWHLSGASATTVDRAVAARQHSPQASCREVFDMVLGYNNFFFFLIIFILVIWLCVFELHRSPSNNFVSKMCTCRISDSMFDACRCFPPKSDFHICITADFRARGGARRTDSNTGSQSDSLRRTDAGGNSARMQFEKPSDYFTFARLMRLQELDKNISPPSSLHGSPYSADEA